MKPPPILRNKRHREPSVFSPENLLREARRQKILSRRSVPRVCVLDPDGDIVRTLLMEKRAKRDPAWACYHTELYAFVLRGRKVGIIGCAVGASFAVLLAEELFASGCELLISVTSSGQISRKTDPPYFILIEKALRDEGTSYHYMPPSDFSRISPKLSQTLRNAFDRISLPVQRGSTWTTDAPFRETKYAIERCRALGILAVEMEAAALYAFAEARTKSVVCLAHVTNQMAQIKGDFEKGAANGAHDALTVIGAVARTVRRSRQNPV